MTRPNTQKHPDHPKVSILKRGNAPDLAYVYSPVSNAGSKPTVVFLGGYRSDMMGTKAIAFEELCAAEGISYLRMDYSGHGLSDGCFDDLTIGEWRQDVNDILDHLELENIILVGSSMGGWMALLTALDRPNDVKGLIGIAAAPDFSETIYHEDLTDAQRDILDREGELSVPNDYSDTPYLFKKSFFEEAKNNLVMTQKQNVPFPIFLVQGMLDKDVPWQTAERIKEVFGSDNVNITYVEDGDHRLSTPGDIDLTFRYIKDACQRA